MSDRRDRSDHSEGCVLGDSQAVITADGVALQKLDPRDELHDLQLLDLVVESADLCLFEFHAAQLFGLLVADAIDAGNGLVRFSIDTSRNFSNPLVAAATASSTVRNTPQSPFA